MSTPVLLSWNWSKGQPHGGLFEVRPDMTERATQAVTPEETVEESSILTDESRFHLWRRNDKESRGSKTIE